MRAIDEIIFGIIGYFLIDRVIRCSSHAFLGQPLDGEHARCRVELGLLAIVSIIFGVRLMTK